MDQIYDKVVPAVLLFAPRLLGSLAVLAAFWMVAAVAQRLVVRVGRLRHLPRDVTTLMRQAVKVAAIAFGLITALGTSGFNVAGLVTGLGLTGFALGFALRDILTNTMAGLMILSYRPFQDDDRVLVAGLEGQVKSVDLRYTTLENDERRILVPNSAILTNPVSIVVRKADAAPAAKGLTAA